MSEEEMRQVMALHSELAEKEREREQLPSVSDVATVMSVPEDRVQELLAEVRRRSVAAKQEPDVAPQSVDFHSTMTTPDYVEEEVYYRRRTSTNPLVSIILLVVFLLFGAFMFSQIQQSAHSSFPGNSSFPNLGPNEMQIQKNGGPWRPATAAERERFRSLK